MNRKNLIDAFGDIDEEMFARAEKIDITDYEESESQPPVIVYRGGKKMNKSPIFAAGAAACIAAIAVIVPIVMRNGGGFSSNTGVSSDTESSESIAESSDTESSENMTEITDMTEVTITTAEETAPVLTLPYEQDPEYKLLCENKALQKAEEKYNVTVSSDFDETMREKLQMYRYTGRFIDGNDIFYAVDAMYSLSKTACIYRSSMDGSGEAELLLEEAPRIEGRELYIRLIGVIGDYLYYERKELNTDPDTFSENGYGLDFESELRRINLSNNTDEMITKIETTDYGKYMADRYAISGNYIYIAEIMYFDPDKLYRIRRHDTVTGETELFKANAYDLSPFKDGIIYHVIDDNAFYYHNDKDNTDSYLFDYPFGSNIFPPVAFGGDVIVINHDNYIGIMEEKDGVYTERIIIETSSQVSAAALIAPCKGFIPLGSLPTATGRVPVFYDEENDWFAEISGVGEDVSNWNWIKSSEDTLCLIVYDDEERVEKIYTIKSAADTTSAAVKDPEDNSIKPNNGEPDEKVAFLAYAEQLVSSVEQIEELRRLLMETEGVTDVQVYSGSDASQNTEHRITEGRAEKGMIVKVFYDNGKSWVEFTKQ